MQHFLVTFPCGGRGDHKAKDHFYPELNVNIV